MKRNMKAKQTVWEFMLDNAGKRLYLSQIAKKTKLAVSTVHGILERLIR